MKHLHLILALIVGVLLSFTMGAFAAQVAGANPTVVTVTGLCFIGAAFINKAPKGAFRSELSTDLTAIQKYVDKVSPQLYRRFFNALDIASDINLIPNIKDSQTLPRILINGKPKPYSGVFKAQTNDIVYGDRELKVGDFQRDIALDPRRYRTTYLSRFMTPGSGVNQTKIPFAEFTVNTVIGENAAVLNNRTAFFGLGKSAFTAFNPASTYAVGNKVSLVVNDETKYFNCLATTTAGESPVTTPAKWEDVTELAIAKGLGTIIKEDRTNNVIKRVASTGVITVDNAWKQAIDVYRKLPEALRSQSNEIFLYASNDIVDMIADSFKDDIRKYTNEDGVLAVLPRTDGKCKIKRATWMSGSNLMIATPKSNLNMGTDLLSDASNVNTIRQMYHLELGLTGLIGFQYADEDAIALNDQN